jgi:hypothetical protein
MKNNKSLQVTENLLILKRGREELLFANYLDLRPLYIIEGRKYIDHFLEAASQLLKYNQTTSASPQDIDLLDMLMEYGIIVPHESSSGADLPLADEQSGFHNKKIYLFSHCPVMQHVLCLLPQQQKDLLEKQEPYVASGRQQARRETQWAESRTGSLEYLKHFF